ADVHGEIETGPDRGDREVLRKPPRDGHVPLLAVLAEYATGLAGSLSLLLRLRYGGPRAWLPEGDRATP
ncbi:hypothetical protein, partial [Streptomyces sp. NPDC001274]